MKKKLLLIRLDKIGDLVSTLCVDQVINHEGRTLHDEYEVVWCLQKGLGLIAESSSPVRKYLELDKTNPTQSRQQLRDFLAQEKIDMAVSFHAPWWVAWELFKAQVKLRAGVLSKLHSFFFFNRRIRQKRSRSLKHEADYNTELICRALHLPAQESPLLKLSCQNNSNLLASLHLSPHEYSVVHPGMAGSAKNWSSQHFIKIISHLSQKNPVVVTGTKMDEIYLQPIKDHFRFSQSVLILQDRLSLAELLVLLKSARQVIAPSTGVLHLAAALGTPVYGIYSPIRVQDPRRWAPRGEGSITLFKPYLSCPVKFECLGDKCPHYDCMNLITTHQVIEKLL